MVFLRSSMLLTFDKKKICHFITMRESVVDCSYYLSALLANSGSTFTSAAFLIVVIVVPININIITILITITITIIILITE